MLWDLIFEFYIKYIFGGNFKNNIYTGFIGIFPGTTAWYGTSDLTISLNGFSYSSIDNMPLPIGNYFSLIATIITMIIILLIIAHFIKKAFNLFGRII